MFDVDLIFAFVIGYAVGRGVGIYQQRKSEEAWISVFSDHAGKRYSRW